MVSGARPGATACGQRGDGWFGALNREITTLAAFAGAGAGALKGPD